MAARVEDGCLTMRARHLNYRRQRARRLLLLLLLLHGRGTAG